jgi:uncharacterized linocin/CFP29 family protein
VNHLLRSSAPISEGGWEALDQEARERITPALAARKLVDFSGPHGWTYSATNLGRTSSLASTPVDGVSARRRRVLPLVELRADFAVSRDDLRDADRGAGDIDLGDLDRAAHRIATAENTAVLRGLDDASPGIAEAATLGPLELGDAAEAYPARIAQAVEALLGCGIAGPHALALGTVEYRLVLGAAEQGGYPVLDHLRQIADGGIVWAPGLEGAVLVSQRGGDFAFEVGQDISIGYESHDGDAVRLYLEESFSFHVKTAEAAIVLRPGAAPQ